MNKEFTYLNEIAYWLLDKNTFTHDEYNLSGARLSSKTYSVSEELAIIIAIAIKKKKKIALYPFRKLNKDINDLVKEIYEALITIGFQDYKDFSLKYPNKQADFRFKGTKSFIRVMGVYSNSNDRIPLKGLSRAEIKGFDLALEWEEEANEFTQSEFQAITFALGNAKKRIKITTCNPDNIYQYHISYMNDRVPFNLEIMQTKNEQIKSIIENNKFKLFHYTNWKINKHNLSQDIINNLEELKVLDPIKAQSWYDGVPSVLQGAIFARYLNKVKNLKEIEFQVKHITAGIDIGMSTSPTGHPSTASLWFIGETRLHKPKEYFHSNATMQFKDSDIIATEMIDYYCNLAKKYNALYYGLEVGVDYGNGGLVFIDTLKRIAKNKNIKWLKFVGVDKTVMYLNDRIDFTTTMMINNAMSIDYDECPQTIKQYSLIQWLPKNKIDNANNEPQMLDLHDDTWDSDCYAWMKHMKTLMNKVGNKLLIKKDRWE